MKKRILLVMLALVMCLSMVLTSCDLFGKDVQELAFSDVFTPIPSKDDDATFISSSRPLAIDGNIINTNSTFAVVEKDIERYDNYNGSYNVSEFGVYNFASENTVLTLTESRTYDSYTYTYTYTNYYFNLINEEYFAVLTEKYGDYYNPIGHSSSFGISIKSEATYTVDIYNKTGAEVDTFDATAWTYEFDYNYYNSISDYTESEPDTMPNNLGLFYDGDKLYKYENDEKVLVKEFGIEYMPNLNNLFAVGDYYYYADYNDIVIYNSEFTIVANYALPSYADTMSVKPLGNDRFFIQYVETLHQDAKDYDFREGETGKYDLVTVIYNITEKTATELKDVNFMVRSINPTYTKNVDEDYLKDTVQNVAMITYIDENEHLDLSSTNYEIVGMSNEGEITATIEIAGCIAALPTPYGDGLFSARSALDYDMYYIYNAQGEIISYRDISQNIYHGDYIYTDTAIYTLNGDKVYELEGKEVEFMNGGAAIIYTTDSSYTSYYLFYDGTLKTIGKKSEGTSGITEFDSSTSYYYTYKASSDKYTYYNAKGDMIGTFDTMLYSVAETEDYVIMGNSTYDSITGATVYNYYKFDKVN